MNDVDSKADTGFGIHVDPPARVGIRYDRKHRPDDVAPGADHGASLSAFQLGSSDLSSAGDGAPLDPPGYGVELDRTRIDGVVVRNQAQSSLVV